MNNTLNNEVGNLVTDSFEKELENLKSRTIENSNNIKQTLPVNMQPLNLETSQSLYTGKFFFIFILKIKFA